jgi:4-diphosphocytidyl-2-C-methyl-D-erythritol kinase
MLTDIRNAPAPAKLNLFLHVTGRRADGYHELETVFQLIDFCDRVHLHRREDGEIRRIGAIASVPVESDLVIRAARLLQQASGSPLGADISLDKHIPMGGGLGGGSSDAATVLMALNRLWALNWPSDQLAALGLALGADVPFFIFGRTAYARGVGGCTPGRGRHRRDLRCTRFDTSYRTPQNRRSFAGHTRLAGQK